MPKEMDLVKLNTIKRYAKEVKQMRISSTSADSLRIRFNTILKKVLTEAAQSARKDKRSTIMPRDVTPALEQHLGPKKLKPEEVFRAIKKLAPIELGALSKRITVFIEREKKSE